MFAKPCVLKFKAHYSTSNQPLFYGCLMICYYNSRQEDKDVLLTAKNPLYDADLQDKPQIKHTNSGLQGK